MNEGLPLVANQNENASVVRGEAAHHLAHLEAQYGVVRGEHVPVVSKEAYRALQLASLAADIEQQESQLDEQKALLEQLQSQVANDTTEPLRNAA